MGMIGNQLAAGTALTVANDSFNGNGSTTAFTLSQTVSATTDIEVLVDNVQQSPYDSSYSVSGTTLTFSGAPAAGTNNIYVIYNASKHISTNQVIPDDASVTHSKLHTNATLPITRDMTNNRVGINATSPYKTLTVSKAFGGSAEDILDLQSTTSGGGTAPKVRFGTFAANSNTIGRLGFVDNPNYGGDFVVETNSSGSASDATTEKFRITKEGYVAKPNTPHLLAMGFHSFVSGTMFGKFQTITTNTGNHYNNTDGRFTCPVDGRYFVSAFSGYKQATNHAGIGIAYNGSVLAYGWSEGDDRHATQGTTLVYDANANDYFNYFCHSSYTSPILPTGSDHHSFFSVYLLG